MKQRMEQIKQALAGTDGPRTPGENELAIARYQGRHVAQIAAKLK